MSAIIQKKFSFQKKSFKKLVEEASIIVPLKLYDKPKQTEFEEYLLKYMKLYARQEYNMDILRKSTFMEDVKMQQSDVIKLFKSFKRSRFFVPALRDRLLNMIYDEMETFSTSQLVDVIVAFSSGAYNDSDYKKAYQKMEIMAILKIRSFKVKDLVKIFNSFCKFGQMSI